MSVSQSFRCFQQPVNAGETILGSLSENSSLASRCQSLLMRDSLSCQSVGHVSRVVLSPCCLPRCCRAVSDPVKMMKLGGERLT